MAFEFVENGRIDPSARRLIRSHVMKGKNAGKIRTRSSRKTLARQKPTEGLNSSILIPSFSGCPTELISVPSTLGNSFSCLLFPSPIQPHMVDLIRQFIILNIPAVYPIEFCLPVDVKKMMWFTYLQSDEAFFHSTLAMSEVSLDSMLGRKETSLQALQHLSNTYRCVGQNLKRDGAPSDPTIAAVLSLALHEDFRGYPGRSKVHIDALQRMVELRGGIVEFGTNHVLVHKICRADVEYALHAGTYPRFHRDRFPSKLIRSMLSQLNDDESVFPDGNPVEDLMLLSTVVDLKSACILINSNKECFRLEPYAYQEILLSICYRLLHRYPLAGDGPEDTNGNALYLGMLAFMTTLLFQQGRARALSYDLLSLHLRHIIENPASTEIEPLTFLWLMFIGGISIFDIADLGWLLPRVKQSILVLNIDNWQNAREKLKSLPWIDVFHDKRAYGIWQLL